YEWVCDHWKRMKIEKKRNTVGIMYNYILNIGYIFITLKFIALFFLFFQSSLKFNTFKKMRKNTSLPCLMLLVNQRNGKGFCECGKDTQKDLPSAGRFAHRLGIQLHFPFSCFFCTLRIEPSLQSNSNV